MIIICVFEKQITVAFALLVTFVFALQIKCCLKTIDNSHFCTTNNDEVYNTDDRCAYLIFVIFYTDKNFEKKILHRRTR